MVSQSCMQARSKCAWLAKLIVFCHRGITSVITITGPVDYNDTVNPFYTARDGKVGWTGPAPAILDWYVMVKMDPPKLVPPGTNFSINKDPPVLILLQNVDSL